MVSITSRGKIVLNDSVILHSRAKIINGDTLLNNGSFILNLKDHGIPVYEITSTLQSKALIDTHLSYNITFICVNDADPGDTLSAFITLPEYGEIIVSESNEGILNTTSGLFTFKLNSNNEAVLNIILHTSTAGTESQSIEFTGDESIWITSNCENITTDTDGNITYHDFDAGGLT